MSFIARCFSVFMTLTLLAVGMVAFAHGGESMEMRHPETQIGLPGSIMSSDEMIDDPSGMTREEVAHTIEGLQKPEESRILFKLIILSLSVLGLVYLYYPRKSVAQPATSSDATLLQVPSTEATAPVHAPDNAPLV